jgi:hypothetical protein
MNEKTPIPALKEFKIELTVPPTPPDALPVIVPPAPLVAVTVDDLNIVFWTVAVYGAILTLLKKDVPPDEPSALVPPAPPGPPFPTL